MSETTETRDKVQIDWTRAVAGALAAVASAVLLSTLGAAGTILGAAIGSFVVTVASAMFTQGLSTSKRKLTKKQEEAAAKVGVAHAEVLRATRAEDAEVRDSHLDHADERLAEAGEDLAEAIEAVEEATPPTWRERLSGLPWKRIGLTTAALFVVALAVITVIELVAGESVSSITGGSDDGATTIGDVGGGEKGHADPEDQPTSPAETDQPDQQGEPDQSDTPSVEPTAEPSATDSQEPTPTESATPSEDPGQTPGELPAP